MFNQIGHGLFLHNFMNKNFKSDSELVANGCFNSLQTLAAKIF